MSRPVRYFFRAAGTGKSPGGGQRQTPGCDLGGERLPLPSSPQGDKPQARLAPAPAHILASQSQPHLALDDADSRKTKPEVFARHVHHRIIHNSRRLGEGQGDVVCP